jgi:hypothetical protein
LRAKNAGTGYGYLPNWASPSDKVDNYMFFAWFAEAWTFAMIRRLSELSLMRQLSLRKRYTSPLAIQTHLSSNVPGGVSIHAWPYPIA